MFGSSAIQFVGWEIGTVVGVFGGSAIGDPKALGIDAIYPAFFLALMIVRDPRRPRARRRRARRR